MNLLPLFFNFTRIAARLEYDDGIIGNIYPGVRSSVPNKSGHAEFEPYLANWN